MKFMKVFCCLLNNFWCDSFDSFIGAEPLDVRLRNVLLRSEILLSRSEKCCIMCYLRARCPQNMMGFEFLTMLKIMFMMMLESFLLVVVFMDVHVSSKWKTHHFWMLTKALHTSSSIRWYTLYTLLAKVSDEHQHPKPPTQSWWIFLCVFCTPFWELWHVEGKVISSHFTSFFPIASIYGNMDPMFIIEHGPNVGQSTMHGW